jgi:H+/Cl- antiporter ClcA
VPDAPTLDGVLRRPGYLRLLVLCGVIGIPVSMAAFGFLALEHELSDVLWEDLPDALGFDEAPDWWGIPSLIVAGVLVAVVVRTLPGGGGHPPAEGLHAGPTEPRDLPGVFFAGLASLCLGAVIGPEGILLAVGSAVALLLVPGRWRRGHQSGAALIGATGAFAAISTILGSPVIAAVFMIEAIGLGGAQMFAVLLPGLVAAGVGALMFVGLGDWTGIEIQTLAIPNVPEFARPDVYDVLWSAPLGVGCALAAYVVRLGARLVLPRIRARPSLIPLAGACVGVAACLYALVTGHPPQEALFSGQATIETLVTDPGHWTEAELLMLAACFGFGYALSLAAFRGGPIFPAVLLGVMFGVLLDDLPGLGRTPGIAIGMAGFAVAMLRLPLSSIVLVAVLLGPEEPGVIPLAILAAVTAFVVTELIDPPRPASSTP